MIHNQTNDAQLAPYTDWSDFGQHLKHPESLVNYVAAYGTHPTIRTPVRTGHRHRRRRLTVGQARRRAGDRRPAADGHAAGRRRRLHVQHRRLGERRRRHHEDRPRRRRPVGRRSRRGHEPQRRPARQHVQLRVPEHAGEPAGQRPALLPEPDAGHEPPHAARGQLVRRADRAQHGRHAHAEGRRVRDGRLQVRARPTSSRADARRRPAITGAGSVDDDPNTDCDENAAAPAASRTARSSTAPATPSTRRASTARPSTTARPSSTAIFGGNDNDTIWGNEGNDILEGNGGDDDVLGGDGNDIITDLDGADVLKGGDGNDAIDGGPGDDIIIGGNGERLHRTAAPTTTRRSAARGTTSSTLGQGADAGFGDGGDDWMQGGTGQDLLQGDHGAPFFDDPAREPSRQRRSSSGRSARTTTTPRAATTSWRRTRPIDRNAGAGGFDWAFHQYDTVGADDDMEINNQLAGPPAAGRRQPRPLAGDGGRLRVAVQRPDQGRRRRRRATVGGAGFTGCDALDQAGLDRITGLARSSRASRRPA